jgi:hypothetical protein
VGKAVSGKQREIVHDTSPEMSHPLVAVSRRKVHGCARDHPPITTPPEETSRCAC